LRQKLTHARHGTTVHADLEPAPAPVDQAVELSHTGIVRRKNVRLLSQADRFMQQEDHPVDPLRKVIPLKPVDGLIDRVAPQHIVDAGLDPGLQQHVDGAQSVRAAVPADRHRTAVPLAELRQLWREAVAGGGVVGDDVKFPAGGEDGLKLFVLIGVAPAAQGKLVDPAAALFGDADEIRQGHVRLLNRQPALVAAHPCLEAQPAFPMVAVPHDPDIDQVREGRLKWVNAGINARGVQDAGAHVGARFGVEHGYEVVLFVDDFLIHIYRKLILRCPMYGFRIP
jgi:hypothetical protein